MKESSFDFQIQRIIKMESAFDEISDCIENLPEEKERMISLLPDFRRLISYYGSGWRKDYEDDQNGRFPEDLKRGILSEDAIYDLLTEIPFIEETIGRPVLLPLKPVFGSEKDLDSWMILVTKVHRDFPGLETDEALEAHKQTVLKFMDQGGALCVKDADTVVGILLFSKKQNMICCLAVDPDHRELGIASSLLEAALSYLDRQKDITVSTFCDGDPKGIAPRALYRKFGFVEGDLCEEFGYPNQRFILHFKPHQQNKEGSI